MYLEYFGLDGPPFKITPVTDFFFPGANRGEILDALIYAITESEGIIKVTGEVGSGKTMLCRMLLERLPKQMENVYLANPSLSREEMLHAIADGLGLNLEGQRVNIIMQTLQNLLTQKSAEGKRVVVLVDEAHAMPLDTLEELRLLYNLQLGDRKLLQIVLFGQPELNDKLGMPNMRQLRDRIVHHFSILPLKKSTVESYLQFRMHTAGYRGPNLFSAAAVNLIGTASSGLMRRVNILADKSLLAAFVENTHDVEVRHVKAAIRDSELLSPQERKTSRGTLAIAGTLSALLLIGAGWFLGSTHSTDQNISNRVESTDRQVAALPAAAPATIDPPVATISTSVAASDTTASSVAAVPSDVVVTAVHPASAPAASVKAIVGPESSPAATTNISAAPLLMQRLTATSELFAKHNKDSASIELFNTTEIQPENLEAFLAGAASLGKLAEIYVLPTQINGKDGIRVLYGAYPNLKAARTGMKQLPQRYKKEFIPKPYLLDSAIIVPHQNPIGNVERASQ